MKPKKQHNAISPDTDRPMVTAPGYDMGYIASAPGASDLDPGSSSYILVQSILDRIYRRESEMPYLFLQWTD